MSLYTNCVTANLGLPEDTLEYRQVRIINFILYLVVFIDLAVISENIKLNQILYVYSNITAAMLALITIAILRKGIKYLSLTSQLTIIVMIVILLPALFEGGIANSGFVWYFLTPPFAVHLLGQKNGLRWVYFLLLSIASVFFFIDQETLPYDKAFLIYLSLALIVETAFSIYLLNIQYHFSRKLNDKNQELSDLTNTLHEKVRMEVDKSRKKDALISQKSKMAAVGDMVSSISHQWKQPLSTVNVLVQNLQLAIELETSSEILVKESLKKVIMQTNLMEETMSDFLLFSRCNAQSVRFSINKAIMNMHGLIDSAFVNANIIIDLALSNEELYLFGKSSEFTHAVMNIANNAKDAFLTYHIENPKLMIKLEKDASVIRLILSDNAGGIPNGIIDKIFDPYFTTKLDSGGTGLGLDLTYKVIVEHLHGSLKVKNSEEGAMFIMEFEAE